MAKKYAISIKKTKLTNCSESDELLSSRSNIYMNRKIRSSPLLLAVPPLLTESQASEQNNLTFAF